MLVFYPSSHAMSRHHFHGPHDCFCACRRQDLGIEEGGPTPFGHHPACEKELVQISSFLMVFGKVVIWQMGPSPTWVGPAPRCGHPGGRSPPPASTGRRPGQPHVSAGRLNCISEVTALLKNEENKWLAWGLTGRYGCGAGYAQLDLAGHLSPPKWDGKPIWMALETDCKLPHGNTNWALVRRTWCPGPTWVCPAPRCGHPTGRAFAPTSTGRRPGRTNAFAARLNCIFEVTALLKNKGGRSSWRGNALNSRDSCGAGHA